ncbi:MAG: hypothetical protein ABSB00_01410 [Minisyncoccia bacterium]|jgi:hypothetical protein
MVYVDCEDMVTDFEPESFALERPGPETVQVSVEGALQVTVELAPDETRVGFALIETLDCDTVTVTTLELTEPPGPVHEI